ncbi:MAG: ribonuclease E/G, partial [Alphaproteobacteria bacterium]|nr:ribonuclease E/G [Alphaproteobacteria bacterium]
MPGLRLTGIDSILIELGADRTRIPLMRDGELVELMAERAGRESRLGWIILGRVREISRPLNAAFVDIGLDQPGFLSGEAAHWLHPDPPADTPIERSLTEGAAVLVQQSKDPHAGKGASLTADIALQGTHLVLTPRRPGIAVSRRIPDKAERARLRQSLLDHALPAQAGVVVRTSATGIEATTLQADLDALLGRWEALQARAGQATPPLVLERPLGLLEQVLAAAPEGCRIAAADLAGFTRARRFCTAQRPDLLDGLEQHRGTPSLFTAEGVEEEIAAALARSVTLPGGGELVIDPTEALVA